MSGELPGAQEPDDVAAVIASVIASRLRDVYTQTGSRDRVTGYYAGLGVDP